MEQLSHLFKPKCIGVVESVEISAINVKNADDLVLVVVDRYDDFTTRRRTTSNMARELINVWHYLRAIFCPRRAAYSTSFLDAGASHRSLERS